MLQKTFLRSLVVAVVAVLVCSGAMAQTKDFSQMDDVQPPNFGPLGEQGCDVGRAISDLRVTIQSSHTWVGDLDFVLTHDDTATSALIYDRPGEPASGFGCSGNDIDIVLHDGAGGGSVETACVPAAIPALSGELTPDPEALAVFVGDSLTGTWTLAATDNAGGDTGSLNTWCLGEGTGGVCCSSPNAGYIDNQTITDTLDLGGGGGAAGDVPATSTWGVIALMALFMGVSLYFLRRRGSASA